MKKNVVFLYILPVITFALGAMLSPALELFTKKFLESYGPFAELITFDVCLPLRRSVVLFRDVDTAEPSLLVPVEALNETSFLIENNLSRTLSKVQITATPITGADYQPNILQAQVMTNAIAASSTYSVAKAGAALQIDIPTWGDGDAILALVKLDRPVAYIIEIYSEDESYREIFEPGCGEGIYSLTPPPTSIFEYNTPDCDTSKRNDGGSYDCTVTTSKIDLPAELRERGETLEMNYIVESD